MLDARQNDGREYGAVQTPIRVLIVDDHAILRAGVREMLSEETDLRVVGEMGHDDPRAALDVLDVLVHVVVHDTPFR